jgi:hypothetical protein
MSLACWDYSIEEQGPHTLLEVIGMMARLPWCLATLGGSTLLTCGLSPPSPPLTMSGALCGLDGVKAEAPSTPCTIPGMGFEQSLQFSLWYK